MPRAKPRLNCSMLTIEVIELQSAIETTCNISAYSTLLRAEMNKSHLSRKTSISALCTMPKHLTVWITINCGKF